MERDTLRATRVVIQVLHGEGHTACYTCGDPGAPWRGIQLLSDRYKMWMSPHDSKNDSQMVPGVRQPEWQALEWTTKVLFSERIPSPEQSETQYITRTIRWRLLKHGFKSCMVRKKPLFTERLRRARHLWVDDPHNCTYAHTGPIFNGQMNPASSYIQIKLMSE